jgi:type VI secretion system protein ImpL
MFAFLKSRVFLVVLGFILLALFIWFAGPLFAFADWRPLESVTARLVVIGLVVLCWVGAQLIKRMRANSASDKLVAAVVQQSRTEARPSADAVQLRERFEEAVATLKQKRRTGHSLYDLPWYVIIGAPGSGKTTALVNSGLHFPLEQRSGKGALRGVGGTRNCDWWFTDEAVFLDTAGRYTTQDSDADADSAGWSEFLKLLQKYRKRRPVNGVILTISAQDLMAQGHTNREAHVAAAKRRLTELNKELNVQLPVYLMVTKVDLVAGFTEYFDDVVQEGRAQVWGVTFPYEVTTSGKAAETFPNEFDALMSRLNERVFARLDEERDARRRTKIFGFPQQMAALRDLLSGFVTDVFASTRFDQQILLRGVYFTSGTQEGTPIDRLLGAIGRRFAVAPEAVIAPPGRGKAYFIERLLKEVMFAESGLAGVNRRFEFQKAAAQLGAYAGMALLAVLGVIVLWVSYSKNRTYIDEVAADVEAFRKTPRVEAGLSLEAIVPRLDSVKRVSDSANRFSEGAPWSMRWGLFQGNSLGNAARDAYSRELAGALLPQVTSRIEQRMVAYASEPLKMYEYLKAYLMLGDPARMVKPQFAFIADREWKAAYPADPDLGQAVARHFKTLLDSEELLRPMPLDQALVARARATIAGVSIPELMYQSIRLSYAEDSPLRLDTAVGIGVSEVFARKSRTSFSQPIPKIYTREAFKEIAVADSALILKKFTDDYWVWGDQRPSLTSTAKLREDMIGIYEKDYIAAWDAILNDFELAASPGLAATTNRLALLAAPTSPLRGLLKVVRDNTTLVEPEKPSDPAATSTLKKTVDAIFKEGKEQVGLSNVRPGAQVTAHFEPIRRLVDGDPGSAPIDRVINQIGAIQKQLSSVGTSFGDVSPLEALTKTGQGDLMTSLQQDAKTLPPAVGAIVTQITGRASAIATTAAGNELQNRYRQDVVAVCQQLAGGRYPFAASSMSDVAVQDFTQLFGPNGVFDRFFKTYLQNVADTTRTPWVWRTSESGASVGVSTAVLRQFELAQRIRDRFFAGSPTLQVNFSVTPTKLDAAVSRFILEIDGQRITYQHEAERTQPVRWPGPMPGAAAVTFEDRASGRPNIVFQGAWAWFHLLDAAQIRPESDLRYEVTFEKGGYTALVRIEASSVLNPFGQRDLQQFRCEA